MLYKDNALTWDSQHSSAEEIASTMYRYKGEKQTGGQSDSRIVYDMQAVI